MTKVIIIFFQNQISRNNRIEFLGISSGYAALVYDEKIWLLGCNRNGQFSSQVLFSANGKNWEEQAAPWTPRGGIAAAVFKEKIFMTGGKYGGTPNQPDFRYSNDIWVLEKRNK